jgi:hypothetical protein
LPGVPASTVPAVDTSSGPTQLSAAVAPESTKAVAHSSVAGFAPATVTTGGVVSVTCTERTTCAAWLPAWSAALYVTA